MRAPQARPRRRPNVRSTDLRSVSRAGGSSAVLATSMALANTRSLGPSGAVARIRDIRSGCSPRIASSSTAARSTFGGAPKRRCGLFEPSLKT